jgi:16S rRNA U516 pseudouridylate synthase RsuA-like enzyme
MANKEEITCSNLLPHGRRLVPVDKVYLMLNKPRCLVTTTGDEKGR